RKGGNRAKSNRLPYSPRFVHPRKNTHLDCCFQHAPSGELIRGRSLAERGDRARSSFCACLLSTGPHSRFDLLHWYGSYCCTVSHGGCGDPIAHPPTSKFRRSASCSRQAFVLGLSRLRPRSRGT